MEKKKRKEINELMTNQEYAHAEFSDHYMSWKANQDLSTIDTVKEQVEEE